MLKLWLGILTGAVLVAGIKHGYAQVDLPISTPAPRQTLSVPAAVSPASAPELTGAHLLKTMFAYLDLQKSWYAEVMVTSTLTLSGLERRNSSRSRIWMRRPHHVVWTNQGDSGNSAMSLDGNQCILYLPSLMRYTVSNYSGAADDHLLAMSSLLGPLASALLSAEPTSASVEQLLAGPAELLGVEKFHNISCYRLRLPTSAGDTEMWLATGVHPLPVKLVSRQAMASSGGTDAAAVSGNIVEMDFRWKLNVTLPDSTFKLKLPETAQRVDVLGGPNLAAGSLKKPATGRKSTNGRKDSPQKSSARLGLEFEPPPVVGVGARSALAHTGQEVPSLSKGLLPLDPLAPPSQSTSVGTTQKFRPATPSGNVASASTQQFEAPRVGQMTEPRQVQVINPAPDVELPLIDGGSVRLSSLRGKKAVVLDFWATWCGPCRQAMPAVAEAAHAWKSRGVDFYAVNMAEAPEQIRSFSKQQGLSIPVAMDADGKLAAAFGVSGIPHLVVIGRDGGIRGVHTGADKNLRQKLERELETAL